MSKCGSPVPFYCVLIYRPPGPARLFLEEFTDFLSSIVKLEHVLILGDFKLYVDNPSCQFATEFLFMTETFNFKQHVSDPSHNRGHILDLVLSTGLDIEQLMVEDVLISDHYCVSFNLSNMVIIAPPISRVVRQRRFINQAALDGFSVYFDPSSLAKCSDTQSFMNCFHTQCLETLNTVAPVKHCTRPVKKPLPWMNIKTGNLKRLCRKTERLWKASKLEVHRLHLKNLIMELNKSISCA